MKGTVENPTKAQKAFDWHPKLASSAIGGWLTGVIVYVLSRVDGWEPTAEEAIALTGMVMFIFGWLAPNRPAEVTKVVAEVETEVE